VTRETNDTLERPASGRSGETAGLTSPAEGGWGWSTASSPRFRVKLRTRRRASLARGIRHTTQSLSDTRRGTSDSSRSHPAGISASLRSGPPRGGINSNSPSCGLQYVPPRGDPSAHCGGRRSSGHRRPCRVVVVTRVGVSRKGRAGADLLHVDVELSCLGHSTRMHAVAVGRKRRRAFEDPEPTSSTAEAAPPAAVATTSATRKTRNQQHWPAGCPNPAPRGGAAALSAAAPESDSSFYLFQRDLSHPCAGSAARGSCAGIADDLSSSCGSLCAAN